ncbi:MAG: pitrilysin family protein, partial [Bacteroidota bacterium]
TGYKAPNYGYNGLKYNKAKDNFDRSKMPGNGPAPIVKAPDFWRQELPGNVKLIGAKTDEIPVVTIMLHFKGGKMIEAGDLNKTGTANLFAIMMEEDTKNYTSSDFASALEKLGSSVNVAAAIDGVDVTIRSLSKNIDKTMELAAERILRPKFTEEAFTIAKKRVIEGIKNGMNQPNVIATKVYSKLNYGANSVLGRSSSEESVKNIQLADIENFYKNYFSKEEAEVIVVGDVDQKDIEAKMSFLKDMSTTKVYLPNLPTPPIIEKTKIYFVNVPNAAQTEFRIGYVTSMPYDALGEFYKSSVMNFPFGEAFNSRLNLDLREDKGWTYGARGYFIGDKYTGTYTFSAGIKAVATDSALTDVINILTTYRQGGMSYEELNFTKKSMGLSEARKYETGFQKASFLSRIMEYDLPADYSRQQNEMLNKFTTADLNSLAVKNLPSEGKMNIVLVGDKVKVWDGLQKFGYEVVELDKEGNPMK